MRVADDVFVAGTSVVLPRSRQSMERAVEAGLLNVRQAADSTVTDLPVACEPAESESMLIEAAGHVLTRVAVPVEQVGLVAYAWMVEAESDWRRAPRAARLVGAHRAVAFGLRQMSNGGAMAVQLATANMLADPALRASLILTADALGPLTMSRWHHQAGAAMGDCATAMLLSRHAGPFAVRSIASSGDSVQEAELSGPNPYGTADSSDGAKVAFGGRSLFHMRRCVREAVQEALRDAGLGEGEPPVSVIVLPRLETWLLRVLLKGLLPERGVRRRLHLAAETGHAFAGDLTANVDHLLREKVLSPGEYALILNIGGGFTATCIILQACSPQETD